MHRKVIAQLDQATLRDMAMQEQTRTKRLDPAEETVKEKYIEKTQRKKNLKKKQRKRRNKW